MGFFTRREQVRAASTPTPSIGIGGMDSFASQIVGTGRERAMSIPTINRARDILASLIGVLPIRKYEQLWNGTTIEEVEVPPEPWMDRPDPNVTRAHLMAWTFDDLLFHGRAFWHVDARSSTTGLPVRFSRLPAELVNLQAQIMSGNAPVSPITVLSFNGIPLNPADVVIFYSPISPLLQVGARAISTALKLELAANRFAASPTAFGWLQATGGEQVDDDELQEMANGWAITRTTENVVAALNQYVEYRESNMDPSRLQLVEARQYSSLECSRLANIPPYLVGAPTGTGMTYQNAAQARGDALIWGALPYVTAISETLSSPNILGPRYFCRLDTSDWTAAAENVTTNVPALPTSTSTGVPS